MHIPHKPHHQKPLHAHLLTFQELFSLSIWHKCRIRRRNSSSPSKVCIWVEHLLQICLWLTVVQLSQKCVPSAYETCPRWEILLPHLLILLMFNSIDPLSRSSLFSNLLTIRTTNDTLLLSKGSCEVIVVKPSDQHKSVSHVWWDRTSVSHNLAKPLSSGISTIRSPLPTVLNVCWFAVRMLWFFFDYITFPTCFFVSRRSSCIMMTSCYDVISIFDYDLLWHHFHHYDSLWLIAHYYDLPMTHSSFMAHIVLLLDVFVMYINPSYLVVVP